MYFHPNQVYPLDGCSVGQFALICFVRITKKSKQTRSTLEMRRYGDISIQYQYIGPRYVSRPRTIYCDTTLTFIIRGSQCIFTVFSVFDRFKIFLLETFTFLILNFHYFSFSIVHVANI